MKRVPFGELHFGEDGLFVYQGWPFTGFSESHAPNGQLVSEIEYRGGHRWGKTREWFRDGTLAEESHWRQGVGHGLHTEWDEEGNVTSQTECEFGVLLRERARNDSGVLVDVYVLSDSEPAHAQLEAFRELYRVEGEHSL